MYRVIVTAAAKQNLRDACLWAAERAPDTAALWLQRFEAEVGSHREFSRAVSGGSRKTLRRPESVSLSSDDELGAYRALFTIVEEEVQIVHIRRATAIGT